MAGNWAVRSVAVLQASGAECWSRPASFRDQPPQLPLSTTFYFDGKLPVYTRAQTGSLGLRRAVFLSSLQTNTGDPVDDNSVQMRELCVMCSNGM